MLGALTLGALALGCSGEASAPDDATFHTAFETTPSLAASYQPQFLPLLSYSRAEPEHARDVDVLERERPSPDDKAAYRRAQQVYVGLRELPAYKRLQREYLEFAATLDGAAPGADSSVDDATWETYAAAQPELVFYGDGARSFVGWNLNAGEGCGDFYANLSVIYEVVNTTDGEQLRLIDASEAHALPERVLLSAGELQWIDPSADPADSEALPVGDPEFGCGC